MGRAAAIWLSPCDVSVQLEVGAIAVRGQTCPSRLLSEANDKWPARRRIQHEHRAPRDDDNANNNDFDNVKHKSAIDQ